MAGSAFPTNIGWLPSFPIKTSGFTANFQHYLSNGEDRYQADYLRPADDRAGR